MSTLSLILSMLGLYPFYDLAIKDERADIAEEDADLKAG